MTGEKIQFDRDVVNVPDRPVILFIGGDGIGPEIWDAARRVLDAAVECAYAGARGIEWREVLAGEKAFTERGSWLPDETIEAIREFKVAIKGPLTTPVGGGIRSINVLLRKTFGLYASVRPVRWIPGVPSPVKEPEKVDMIVFRENLEDVYAGVEWKHGSPEAAEVIRLINAREGQYVAEDSAIGIKPMSARNSKNLVRRAIRYAIDNGRASVTLVHKGNIMKYTEGAFREWGYELARDEFPDTVITERECWDRYEGKRPGNLVVLNDRIADDMFQQALLNPARYDVIATTNLNGDYLSDALAAQVGGVGIAPGANMGDGAAIFESIHGTAPRYAGKDIANPSALILSGGMMLRFLGWREAADALWKGLGAVIARKTVTRDLARRVEGATALGCAAFGEAVEKAVLSAGQGAP